MNRGLWQTRQVWANKTVYYIAGRVAHIKKPNRKYHKTRNMFWIWVVTILNLNANIPTYSLMESMIYICFCNLYHALYFVMHPACKSGNEGSEIRVSLRRVWRLGIRVWYEVCACSNMGIGWKFLRCKDVSVSLEHHFSYHIEKSKKQLQTMKCNINICK